MKLICINCPRGCELNVEKVNGEYEVTGNFCVRGKTYAVNELTNPLRTVTTTIAIDSKKYIRLPVISTNPVPKDKVLEVVKSLGSVKVKAPIKMGEVIVKSVLGLESDIIASKTIEE